jgi:chromosome segregation ATPase
MADSGYWQGRVNSYNRQIGDQEARNADLQRQIDRLKITKRKLDDAEDSAQDMSRSLKDHDPSEMWAGAKFDAFSLQKSEASSKSGVFVDDITANYNAVCDKITQLENEKLEGQGLLGTLRQGLNNAWNWLTKAWNDVAD